MTLSVSNETLNKLDDQYEGIRDQILRFEAMELPQCVTCGSEDTALTQVGTIGRTINIAMATYRVKLRANGKGEGRYFCNACDSFFNERFNLQLLNLGALK